MERARAAPRRFPPRAAGRPSSRRRVEHGCDDGGPHSVCDNKYGKGCDPVENGNWGGDNKECPEAEFMPAEVYVQGSRVFALKEGLWTSR